MSGRTQGLRSGSPCSNVMTCAKSMTLNKLLTFMYLSFFICTIDIMIGPILLLTISNKLIIKTFLDIYIRAIPNIRAIGST